MKYYLCTFNPDYADEHNVPALTCFTEEEYNTWLQSRAGKPNANYQEELDKFTNKLVKWDTFVKDLNEKGLSGKNVSVFTPEELAWYDENKTEYIGFWDKPKKGSSYLHAWLGNHGDGFSEGYDDYEYMKEFVDAGIVQVTEVDENFYNTFRQANLNSLSLCNIFECEPDDED